jgi:hypothetical protein
MSDALKPLIDAAANGPLTRAQAEDAFGILFNGEATPCQIGGFLMALRTRGESTQSVSQLAGTAPSKEMVSALATVEGFAADDRTRDLSLRAVAVVTILCSIVRPSRWSPDNHRYFGSALQERVPLLRSCLVPHHCDQPCGGRVQHAVPVVAVGVKVI